MLGAAATDLGSRALQARLQVSDRVAPNPAPLHRNDTPANWMAVESMVPLRPGGPGRSRGGSFAGPLLCGRLSCDHGSLACRAVRMGIGRWMSVAGSSRAGTLLERGESLCALNELLAGVRSRSEGRLVLVGGEAGVGKTALLRGFCEAQAMPVRILWGACEPLRTPRPLGPLVDVGEVVGGELRELVIGAARPYEVAVALLGLLGSRWRAGV